MRRLLTGPLVGLALVVALSGCSGDDQPEVKTLPEVTLVGFDSEEEVDLATLKGPLVVNLWASYCGPCRRELPVLEAFEQQHGDQVAMLGINYQETMPEKAEKLIADSGVTYDLLSDPEAEVSASSPFPVIKGMPFVALVDADGLVAHMEFGVIESVAELEELVEAHLDVRL
ncbi:MAG: TlpA disulfide reductase family protein [Nocardioides sp.]|nr:TlpA disulfide reductase family protein [Nocardioides sp.]